MVNQSGTLDSNRVHFLWQRLTDELAGVFDAHGVCAIVAHQIAILTGTTTLMGVAGSQGKYFDVWICTADGQIQQTRWNSLAASFESLIEAGQAMLVRRGELSESNSPDSELWQLPQKEILSVSLPMPVRANAITPPGVLCLIDPEEDGPLSLENIESLATNITIFLDRAYLQRQVHRQETISSVISDISYSLTSTLSLQTIFQQLMDPIRRTLNVESISVGLIEPPSGDIVFVGMLMGPLFQDLPPIRLKQGQGIAGWVALRRQPVIVNDAYSDERFYSEVDHESGFRTDSMICIPLQVETRVIGVLQAINKQDGTFIDTDLRLLQAIGGPLAAAIENAQLHADVIAQKNRIETILSNMSEGLLTVNSDGIITHANEALLTLLHKAPNGLVGQQANEVLRLGSGSLDDFMRQVIDSVERNSQLATDVYHDRRRSVPVLISGASILDGSGQVSEMILVFSDLRLIRELERMRDDFFHGIIHELRTPLASILMYARLLREGKAQEKEKHDRFLGVIEQESDRLQKMVRQMLELAKMEAREFERGTELVDLGPVFEEMMPPLAERASQKGLVFDQRIAVKLPTVMGSQETVYLIFKNLIDNAIKFTPSGTVEVEAQQEKDTFVFRVKDDGIGIPQEALPNLFGRFFRAQTAVARGIAGTGLGLYMVKESVEGINGRIDVRSTVGVGTTFTVRLPIANG